jgi:hypothetical protein
MVMDVLGSFDAGPPIRAQGTKARSAQRGAEFALETREFDPESDATHIFARNVFRCPIRYRNGRLAAPASYRRVRRQQMGSFVMTAVSASSGAEAHGPRLAFFWWLNQHRDTVGTRAADDSAETAYAVSDANYIPTGTADLWRHGKPGASY